MRELVDYEMALNSIVHIDINAFHISEVLANIFNTDKVKVMNDLLDLRRKYLKRI